MHQSMLDPRVGGVGIHRAFDWLSIIDFIDYTSQANAPVNVKPQGRGGWHPKGIWLIIDYWLYWLHQSG